MNEIEKALDEFKQQLHNSEDCLINGTTIELAISALEKQMPKKPLEIRERHNFRGDMIMRIGKCPECENELDSTYQFCKHCGVELDWSVEE